MDHEIYSNNYFNNIQTQILIQRIMLSNRSVDNKLTINNNNNNNNNSKMVWLLAILISTLISVAQCNDVRRIPLPTAWKVYTNSCHINQPDLSSNFELNTSIPTVLHLDLLRNGKIDDPFFGDNHKKLDWVSTCNVTYACNFTVDKDLQNVEIVFEGIDTYGTIKINKKQFLKTNNSFVEYRIKLTKQDLKLDGTNLLQIDIESTKRHDSEQNGKNRMPFQYAHTRKAAYQYSWDWAPYLNTMGIWKPVYLQYYKSATLDYVWARNKEVTKTYAVINFAMAVKFASQTSKDNEKLVIICNGSQVGKVNVDGRHTYVDVRIEKPKLWWPNGIGEQNLYQFQVKLMDKNNRVIDNKNVLYGIRTVKLDQKQNKFTVEINGYPIYCKGANYVPPDMFYPRTSNPDYAPGYTYKHLLDDAVQSHFNMIRLWGGGQYESDQFFELASRKGIMIFHDFMFSDSIYPSTTEFLQNVEMEVTHQVRRVRNYPCLTLWSGNNQILQGIHSWGWGRDNYRRDYQRLFEQTIPAILRKQNPDIPYIPSSPVNGVGNGGFQRGGDIHYWGVWAAGANFEAYEKAHGPFNSQFGTQAIPVWETVKNFTVQEHRKYASTHFSAHERHSSGFSTHNRYIQTYAHPSKDFEHEIYLSGLVQAFGIEIAIKYQRAAKPKSYGTLYWQFNDAWPAISWSSIDYFGRWKPLQYMAKRLYPDVAVFCNGGKIIVINDNLYTVQAILILQVQLTNGTTLLNKRTPVIIGADSTKAIDEVKKSDYQDHANQLVVHTSIISGREKQMSSTFFFVHFKQLKLDPSSKLFVKVLPQFNMLILRTDKFIKNLYISSTKEYIKLSDNYFDMIANKKYKVRLDSKNKVKLENIKQTLVFRSYLQIHDQDKLDVVYE